MVRVAIRACQFWGREIFLGAGLLAVLALFLPRPGPIWGFPRPPSVASIIATVTIVFCALSGCLRKLDMPAIQFGCPRCQATVEADSRLVGRETTCHNCGGSVLVAPSPPVA